MLLTGTLLLFQIRWLILYTDREFLLLFGFDDLSRLGWLSSLDSAIKILYKTLQLSYFALFLLYVRVIIILHVLVVGILSILL